MNDRFHPKRLTCPWLSSLPVLAAISGALLLAGCGGATGGPTADTSGPSHAAGSGTSGTSTSNSSSPQSPAQLHQDELAFARCMRASGVPNFPDPAAGGGFVVGAGVDPASPATQAAHAKCEKLLPGGGPLGPSKQTHPSAQTLTRFRRIAQCMRRHGVPDFPDPRTSMPSHPFGEGAGIISDIEEVIFVFPSTTDQQAPAFTHAAAVCAFPLHNH
jgi:hypothetical protein